MEPEPTRSQARGRAEAISVSVGAHTIHVPARSERARARDVTDASRRRAEVVRLATFAALSLYGTGRWMTLMRDPPAWRLIGVFGLAVALAGVVPRLRRRSRPAAGVATAVLVLAALPMAGLRWHWVVHLKVAVSATRIGDGLQALPNVLVPYLGSSHAVRLVIVLGAAVLLLAGAAVLALAPPTCGDARRAAAALPLLALAVVPSTLVRPQLAYLQGFVLFALLAAFLWGERLRRDGAATALAVAVAAGAVGALAAPRIDAHKPWIDYRSWAGTLTRTHVDTFNWNQTYGPLRWPRSGHQVLTVAARTGDYWKAEDLDEFDGRAWVLSEPVTDPVALPQPSPASLKRWTQRVAVSITGMRTVNVIAAGSSSLLTGLDGATVPGADPGTLVARRELGPGTSYAVSSYSPHPSAAQLRAVGGRRYPHNATVPYRMLSIPQSALEGSSTVTQIVFPVWRGGGAFGEQVVRASPYARAYALARRLATHARTPYDFVASVERFLSRGHRYDEHPPPARFPLESFLFTHRVGYCQQFSGAMAMLLRMGGIPARVAAGFTPGGFQTETHTWQISDTDAHAWVEAWFPRYGWVRFDPTPTSAPARGGNAPDPILKSLTGLGGSQTIAAPRREIGVNATLSKTASASSGSGPSPWLALPGLLVLAALGWLAWSLLHPAAGSEQLLAELRRAMARTGRPLSDDVTLATLERRFADSPAAAGYVRSLRLARYGAADAPPTAAERRALRRQLAFGLGASGRLRALWALPPRRYRWGRGRRSRSDPSTS
jgi:transglutaminase-like putative cysteine protease